LTIHRQPLSRRAECGTRDDFVDAWYPDKGFGFPGRGPILARNVEDDRENEFDFSTDESVSRGRPAPER
jgi:hypothetical protein